MQSIINTKSNIGTIPVVDDEENNRELLKSVLLPEGYAVIEAVNGTEAVVGTTNNDLIDVCGNSDVLMPDMDGFEVVLRHS